MRFLQKLIQSLAIQTIALGLFFFLYHKFLFYIMREASISLGAVRFNAHVVPLYAVPRMDLSWWLLPAVLFCGAFLFLCYRYFINRRREFVPLICISIACFIAIHISVAQIDGYQDTEQGRILAFLEPYTRTSLEYYGDVPKLDEMGLRPFLRDYSEPELFDTLSGHTRTHPPGGVIFLWGVSKIFGYNLLSASLASIFFTALTVIPIYKLSTRLYDGDEKVARYALALFLITPNFVMFTGTSMDGVFSVFPIVSVMMFYEALFFFSDSGAHVSGFHKGNRYSLLTGLSLALGMFMTYSTVVIGVFLCVLPLLSLRAKQGVSLRTSVVRASFRAHVKVLLWAGAAFIGFYLLLFVLTGFRPVDALWSSIKKDEAGMGTGYESVGRYFNLSFANLFAFLIGVGIPITLVWLRKLTHTLGSAIRQNVHRQTGMGNGSEQPVCHNFVLGYLITLLFFTFSTLYTMEVERIWIFMVPFLIIPVAKYLTTRPRSDFYWVSGMLVVQLLVSEVLLYTYW